MSAYQDENYVTSQVVGGMFVVSSGCIAASTLISGGVMYVESGGIAKDSVLDEYGTLVVLGGGLVENTVVSNGTLNIEGGTHCGKLWIGDEGRVFGGYDRPASIDFTIAGQEAGEDYLINDLSRIDGYITYSVVAASDQTVGIYKLARNADSFFNCGLRVGDTEVERLLTVDNQIEYAGKLYQLTLADDALTLTVSQSANMAPVMIYRSGTMISSGSVISGAVVSGSNTSAFVCDSGMIDSTVVTNSAEVRVISGGTANRTTMSGGQLFIDGGLALTTIVSNSSGGKSFDQGMFYVRHGGVASRADIYGSMYVVDGGRAQDVTVSGGRLEVSSGGIATSTCVEAGRMVIHEGGIVSRTTVSKGSIAFEGGEAFDTTVASGASIGGFRFSTQLYFSHIGSAANTVGTNVSLEVAKRRLHVGNGGRISDVWADFATWIVVSSGGTASNIALKNRDSVVVFGGGKMSVLSGGSVSSVTVDYDACMFVNSGGKAYDTTVSSGGAIGGFSFETTKYFAVIDDNSIQLDDNVEMNVAGRNMSVLSGGTVNRVTVVGGALLKVEHGGCAVATVLDEFGLNNQRPSLGYMNVSSGGVAMDTDIRRGLVYVKDGGVALNTRLGYWQLSGAEMYVESGAVANGVNIDLLGEVHVSSGGVVKNAVVSGNSSYSPASYDDASFDYNTRTGIYGSMYVSSGGHVCNTVLDGGDLYLMGGTASGVTVTSEGARIEVCSGGAVYNADLSANFEYEWGNSHSIDIRDGGFAADIRLGGRANMNLESGGVASNTIVQYDETAYTWDRYGLVICGGTHRGTLQIESGAVVSAYSGAKIDFTVAERTTEDDFLINDMSLITGAPTYTITVSAEQSAGTYKLAQGAGSFSGSLSIGDGTVDYGVLTVNGEALKYDTRTYTLNQSQGDLTLTITGIVKPIAPVAVADTTAVTNQNVTVTASFAKDAVLNEYSLNGGTWTEYTAGIVFTENGSVSFRSTDAAGNVSEVTEYVVANIDKTVPENPVLNGSASGVTWSGIEGPRFAVEYSWNDFAAVLTVTTTGNAVDHYGMPTGTYQWRVNDIAGDDITAIGTDTAQLLQSDEDGNLDVFFAAGKSTWRDFYFARHNGTLGGWEGTGEAVSLRNKNQITDIFAGSDDANILVMTDMVCDATGDALFLDDIFSDSPADVQQARIARIKEIRAGAGDDLVDLTSQRFAYAGSGLTVYGGLGDDTIWANGGNNTLFGDAGNDRLVGASGDDVLVGGAGNDSMHGGGGNDIFTFGANWGMDTVEQLADSTVTLWFESDSGSWDEATRTYSDGLNSVTVTGAAAVTLKFGGDVSALPAGVFSAAASEKIFEDKSKGLLA